MYSTERPQIRPWHSPSPARVVSFNERSPTDSVSRRTASSVP